MVNDYSSWYLLPEHAASKINTFVNGWVRIESTWLWSITSVNSLLRKRLYFFLSDCWTLTNLPNTQRQTSPKQVWLDIVLEIPISWDNILPLCKFSLVFVTLFKLYYQTVQFHPRYYWKVFFLVFPSNQCKVFDDFLNNITIICL